MRAIRSKNTKPELLVRKGLHAAGFRFRLHGAGLPGKPDIVLPKYRAVIFVHGCFWHGHDCKYFKLPKTRPEFWSDKIGKNRLRDRMNIRAVQSLGWRTLVIWECATRGGGRNGAHESIVDAVHKWLKGTAANGQIAENGIVLPM